MSLSTGGRKDYFFFMLAAWSEGATDTQEVYSAESSH